MCSARAARSAASALAAATLFASTAFSAAALPATASTAAALAAAAVPAASLAAATITTTTDTATSGAASVAATAVTATALPTAASTAGGGAAGGAQRGGRCSGGERDEALRLGVCRGGERAEPGGGRHMVAAKVVEEDLDEGVLVREPRENPLLDGEDGDQRAEQPQRLRHRLARRELHGAAHQHRLLLRRAVRPGEQLGEDAAAQLAHLVRYGRVFEHEVPELAQPVPAVLLPRWVVGGRDAGDSEAVKQVERVRRVFRVGDGADEAGELVE